MSRQWGRKFESEPGTSQWGGNRVRARVCNGTQAWVPRALDMRRGCPGAWPACAIQTVKDLPPRGPTSVIQIWTQLPRSVASILNLIGRNSIYPQPSKELNLRDWEAALTMLRPCIESPRSTLLFPFIPLYLTMVKLADHHVLFCYALHSPISVFVPLPILFFSFLCICIYIWFFIF